MRLLVLLIVLTVVGGDCLADDTNPLEGDISAQIESGKLSGQDLANAYFYRASVRLLMQDANAALSDFDQAIAIVPGFAAAHRGRGEALQVLGRGGDAVDALTRGIELGPANDPSGYVLRGGARTAKGDYPEAIADYDKAIALYPKSWQAYSGRGIAKAALNQDDQAINDLDRAIQLDPGTFGETTVDMGKHPLTQEGTPQWSNQTTRVATSTAYYIAEAYLARGKIWFKRERYPQALRDLKQATAKRSRYGEALIYLGLTDLALGKCTEGLNNLTYGGKASNTTQEDLLKAHEPFVRKSECRGVM